MGKNEIKTPAPTMHLPNQIQILMSNNNYPILLQFESLKQITMALNLSYHFCIDFSLWQVRE